ncbi:carbohydrate-binding module family 48 protein [Stemphylium lycopersici]|nr:carbohydrate-binding module family 48 protein [Stemphylium lycopersici]
MGKYTFTWFVTPYPEHSANEVYVTGTFDDWRKTVKLDQEDGIFKKTVELPKEHIQYKFVVNGNWCTNDSARKEDDGHGIINNVLLPEDIVDEEPVNTMSSAAPQSTTAALAADVPKESDKSQKDDEQVPGAFPETPFGETPGGEAQTFNVAPIPATSGLGNPITLAPGEPVPEPSTLTDRTVESTVKHDEEPEQEASTFGVAPIPATAGAGNPIHLAPGEKVPDASTLTSNTVESTARSDPSSYEKSDALPPLAFTPQAERDAKGGMFGIPPVMGNMIPESSLPMGADAKVEQDTGVTIQSSAPTSTTADLAGQVPKEPRGVPETVTDSQQEAHVDPEASANAEAIQEKKEVEQELKETVSEAPATSGDANLSDKAEAAVATAAAGATAGAGLFAAAIYSAKEKAAESTGMNGPSTSTADEVPGAVAESQNVAHAEPEAASSPDVVAEKSAMEQELLSEVPKTNATGESAPAVAVPAVVSDSQQEAHASPEAASSPEVVAEKKAMESELLSEVPKANEVGEPAPAISAATAATAPAALSETVSNDVPEVVADSQQEAHVSPEAAANSEAVAEKSAVESELLDKLPKSEEAGEPAPVMTAATTATAPGATTETVNEAVARDVPEVVAASQQEASVDPAAASNAEAVGEKRAMETELLNDAKSTEAASEPAPVAADIGSKDGAGLSDEALVDSKPLKSSSEPLNAPESESEPAKPSESKPIDSTTDVAFNKQEPAAVEQSQPAATTGTENAKPEATSSAPSGQLAPESPGKNLRKDSDVSPKGTPGSQSIASGADDKKKNKRRSFFGKIKDKLTSKDKN